MSISSAPACPGVAFLCSSRWCLSFPGSPVDLHLWVDHACSPIMLCSYTSCTSCNVGKFRFCSHLPASMSGVGSVPGPCPFPSLPRGDPISRVESVTRSPPPTENACPPLVPSSPQPAGAERYRGGSYSPSQEDTSSSNGRSGISGWNNLHHRSGLSSASASNLEHTCSAPSKARDACSRSSSTWERSPGSEDGRRLGIRVLQRRGGERLWV